jgi:hypothetical protein
MMEKETAELWHRRFGHAGFGKLAKLAVGKLADGVKVGAGEFWAKESEICEPCILAKQTRQPFLDGESETSGVLELVHMDVCRPLEKRSTGGMLRYGCAQALLVRAHRRGIDMPVA